MSSWGHKHFEDDDALDYVGALIEKIAGELDRVARKKKATGDDVLTHAVPRLAVLEVLLQASGSPGPETAVLDRWRAAFRPAFDKSAADMFDDPADARRKWKAIERTFAALAAGALKPEV